MADEREEFEFRARMEQEQATKPEPSALAKIGQAGIKGVLPGGAGLGTGGPFGGVTAIIAELNRQSSDAYDKAAYNVGGTAADLSAKVLPPEAAGGVGYAANVAAQAIPVVAGGAVTKVATSPVIAAGAKRIMQSAIKPDFESLANGKAAKAIQTMLDEGINTTEGGMAKIQKEISRLKGEVTKVIANSPAELDRSKVANELFGVLDRVQKQAKYKGDVTKVEEAFDEFMNHPLINGNKIPIQLAQDMKKAGNRKLNADFGEMSGAEKESQKALVRGLKEGIEQGAPAVAPLNARQAELLNVLKVAQKRSLMDGNKNTAGLSLLAENPMAGAAFALEREAPIRSLLARILHQNSGTIPTATGGGLAALLSRRSGS